MRALLFLLVVSCSDAAETDLGEREHTYTIPGGEYVELRVEIDEGAELVSDWSANSPLPWELHAHPFGMLEVYDQGFDASGRIAFVAPASRPVGMQWSNFGDEAVIVEVTLDLPVGAALIEW